MQFLNRLNDLVRLLGIDSNALGCLGHFIRFIDVSWLWNGRKVWQVKAQGDIIKVNRPILPWRQPSVSIRNMVLKKFSNRKTWSIPPWTAFSWKICQISYLAKAPLKIEALHAISLYWVFVWLLKKDHAKMGLNRGGLSVTSLWSLEIGKVKGDYAI